jgi:hypothetical protein
VIRRPAIEVIVPATIVFVPLLRRAAVTACPPALQERAGDVRLGITEACNLLLQLHAPATRFVMGVTSEGEGMSLQIRSDATVADVPPPGLDDSWSWRLLVSVTDRATFRSSGVGPVIELDFFARPAGGRPSVLGSGRQA